METLELDPRFKDLLKYWLIASKMRNWFSKKKQNLMDRLQMDGKVEIALEAA